MMDMAEFSATGDMAPVVKEIVSMQAKYVLHQNTLAAHKATIAASVSVGRDLFQFKIFSGLSAVNH